MLQNDPGKESARTTTTYDNDNSTRTTTPRVRQLHAYDNKLCI